MPDLTQDGLRARAGEIVAIEPDGKWWRVVLVCGAQRYTVIRLSERAACEAYAVWIQDTILLPTFTALVAEARQAQREVDAAIAERYEPEAWPHGLDTGHMWRRGAAEAIAAALRTQEET